MIDYFKGLHTHLEDIYYKSYLYNWLLKYWVSHAFKAIIKLGTNIIGIYLIVHFM